ncbi:hypothetical protein [Gilliamella sp. B2838]|uniref:hypothetical protein n=1 Tax=Gilliamella sp. B2838 TaxID=2818020 RepID=UPI00226A05AC|nr:hypothetical protein [Gilliamella sp. B2838]MCX8726702.1 hypothetical protein [Gilliamella sp. B2838]
MKKNLIILTLLSTSLIGCGFSTKGPSVDIKPVPNNINLNNVCVYRSVNTLSSYDKAGQIIANKLNELKISNKLTTKDKLTECSYTLSYDIRRAIEIPTYLSIMYVQLDDNEGYSVGSIKYSHIVEGGFLTLSSSSFTNTDKKINELLDRFLNIQSDKGIANEK